MNIILFFSNIQQQEKLIPVDPYRYDWVFFAVVIPVTLLILSYASGGIKPVHLSRLLVNPRYSATSFRSRGMTNLLPSVASLLTSLSAITTFAYFTQVHYHIYLWDIQGPLLWLTDLGLILGSYLFRVIVLYLTAEITANRELFREYQYNINSFYLFLTIIIVFINFLIPYFLITPASLLIPATLVIIILLYLLRIIRLVSIFIRGGFSLFYFILYLCALEFTPLLIFVKYLSGTF